MNKGKILIALLLTITLTYGQQIIHKGKTDYLSNTLVIKVKSSAVQSSEALCKTLSRFSVKSAKEVYGEKNILRKGASILNGIYLAEFSTNEDPVDLAKKVSKISGVVWAEPKYIRSLTYVPNDEYYQALSTVGYSQPNLKQINAEEAWDISKGSKNIIIGIIDTGVDWTHPDLEANILKDADGKKVGWDFGGLDGTPDDEPIEDVITNGGYHGTHVAGIASAVTDNSEGVASIGFNCSILPVKVSRSDRRNDGLTPYVYYGFEGIIYAADKGAKVISCSWGGYGFSAYEQSVIDYAVATGAVVVAAQGNNGSADPFYPADYKGVLSVGWLDTGVSRTTGLPVSTVNESANYGEDVKVFAPGSSIVSTWQRSTSTAEAVYSKISGSSMSTPHVSGLAGLLWEKFPTYTPMQIEERIRVTADDIYEYNSLKYTDLLGRGRINAYNALTAENPISVRADTVNFIEVGNNDGIYAPDEEVTVDIDFINYLSQAGNVKATLSTTDKYVTIEKADFDLGTLNTLQSVSNSSDKYLFKIKSDVPYDHEVHLKIQFEGDNYSDFQWIKVVLNQTYRTHNNNNVVMTIASRGNVGFDDYPNNNAGRGFRYKNSSNLMFEGSFLYGTSANQLMDAARVDAAKEEDFVFNTPMKITDTGNQQIGACIFSDSGNTKLGIQTVLASYSYSQAPDNNYVIIKNLLYNKTNFQINNLYAGYFIDWDIPEDWYDGDTTYFDEKNKIAIAYNKEDASAPYTGIALLTGTDYGYYGIDMASVSDSVVIGDANGFSDNEKWYALHNGVSKKSAGVGDIGLVVSGGPYIIPANDYAEVAFAFAGGSTLDEVITAVQQSKIKYQSLTDVKNSTEEKPVSYKLSQNFPNPFNPSTTIEYTIPASLNPPKGGTYVKLSVYDILGRVVTTLVNETKPAGNYSVKFDKNSLPSGVYFYRLTAGNFSETKKMILMK